MKKNKYRMWHYNIGNEKWEMVDGESLAFETYAPLCELLKEDNEHKFMQCTGLSDADDKDIYEGDIIAEEKLPGSGVKELLLYVVFWSESNARFAATPWKGQSPNGETIYLSSMVTPSYYVVGNIYENTFLVG